MINGPTWAGQGRARRLPKDDNAIACGDEQGIQDTVPEGQSQVGGAHKASFSLGSLVKMQDMKGPPYLNRETADLEWQQGPTLIGGLSIFVL